MFLSHQHDFLDIATKKGRTQTKRETNICLYFSVVIAVGQILYMVVKHAKVIEHPKNAKRAEVVKHTKVTEHTKVVKYVEMVEMVEHTTELEHTPIQLSTRET